MQRSQQSYCARLALPFLQIQNCHPSDDIFFNVPICRKMNFVWEISASRWTTPSQSCKSKTAILRMTFFLMCLSVAK